MSESFSFKQIGVIHTGHTVAEQTPIQPVFAPDCDGRVEVGKEYLSALKGVEGFSHLFLFYIFHKRGEPVMTVTPFMGDKETGVLSTRHPCRPNPLGMSLVKLEKVEGNVLHISGADILDGTPLIDIKPYIPKFDLRKDIEGGWTDLVNDEDAWKRGRRGFLGGAE